uniref:Uncharacterized protein n=1 Tax=Timema douglasi TaxID=61478 RepID=A0A7R8VBA9_TIMDO|nr:unnamed protein product [Timema douglasi]
MTARLVNSSSSSNSSNRSTSSKSSGGHQEKKSKGGGGGGGGSSSTTSAAGVSGGGLPNLAPSVGGAAGAVRPTDGRRKSPIFPREPNPRLVPVTHIPVPARQVWTREILAAVSKVLTPPASSAINISQRREQGEEEGGGGPADQSSYHKFKLLRRSFRRHRCWVRRHMASPPPNP